jgi:hypothetical protein
MSSWPELDLKVLRELGPDLLKNLPHSIEILDQGINWNRQQALYAKELARDTDRLWLTIIHFEYG